MKLLLSAVLIPLIAHFGFQALKEREIEFIFIQMIDGLSMSVFETSVLPDLVGNMQAQQTLQGKRCLVTGGNRGLGKGVSELLHSIGCETIVGTRSTSSSVPLSKGVDATLLQLDLSSFDSIKAATKLPQSPYDVVVLNAGLAPCTNEPTAEGYELALGTNCIGNLFLTSQLWGEHLLAPNATIVVVISETHRAVPHLDLPHLLDNTTFSLSDSMERYAKSKLCLATVAQTLARRMQPHGVAVHTICPGPVATDIARNAPPFMRTLIDTFMKVTFPGPIAAARPVVAIAASPVFAGPAGGHHHMYKKKPLRHDASDQARGDALWSLLWSDMENHGVVRPAL
jgi:NAD(P)-dependent dehydrogenase (short-subunit alcohol dehydrogenase family)